MGKLIKSINAWSFPGGLDGALDPIEAIKLAKAFGYEGLELCIGDAGSALGLDVSDARLAEIRTTLDGEGMHLSSTASGLYWGRAIGDADPALRSRAIEDLHRMIEISSRLGASTHLTIPGAVDVFFLPERPAQRHDEVLQRAIEALPSILDRAKAHGVRLGIENVWNRLFTSPVELIDFIDSFGSDHIGAYFDVGNVLPFGYPEQWIRMLGARVVGVHFKDFRRAVGTAEGFVDLLEGDVNWPEVIRALGEIDYDGPVVAELIPGYKHFPIVRAQNCSRAMDAILGR